jgi:hypothetical protein
MIAAMAAKVCPLCHCPSPDSAWQCPCGYEFGQSADKVRLLLRDAQTNARILLVVMLVLDAAAIAGTIYLAVHGWIVYSVPATVLLIIGTVRMVRKLRIVRESLRQLDERHAPLPRATLRER